MTTCGWLKSVVSISLLGAASLVVAQPGGEVQTIWRCIDSNGKTHVTNVKDEIVGKECKVIQSQRVTVVPAQKAAAKSPAGFPKESSGDRATARERQRATLASELASEEALLAKARTELAAQEAIRTGDEKN